MTEHRYCQLLKEMPSIAKAVNEFTSEAVQRRAFEVLLNAFGATDEERSRWAAGNGADDEPPSHQSMDSSQMSNESRSTLDTASVVAGLNVTGPRASRSSGKSRALYCQEISRHHPMLFLFLLDQSYRMEEPMGGPNPKGCRKADELAKSINSWLANLTIRVTGSAGIKDYLDVGLIGYRTDIDAYPIIGSPLGGQLGKRVGREDQLVFSIEKIGANPTAVVEQPRSFVDDETGEILEMSEKVPVWVSPKTEGGSPMCGALCLAHNVVEQWIEAPEHQDSFPPIVIHITGGKSHDGDPEPYAEAIMDLETTNGHVLLFNSYLSMTHNESLLFPHNEDDFVDQSVRLLFRMSSILPEPILERAMAEGFELMPGARGMAVNEDMSALIRFLDIGTRVATLT